MATVKPPEALADNRFGPARIIADEAEALEVASQVADWLRVGAARRDLERQIPWEELEYISASGLTAIRLPRRLGGAEVSTIVLLEVVRRLAAADPSLAQLYYVDCIKGQEIGEMPESQARFFSKSALQGARWGNGTAERGGLRGNTYLTVLKREGDHYILNGEKHFCTGALTSHWNLVIARFEDGRPGTAVIPAGIEGAELGDDWDVVGQRTTFSVSYRFRNVRVPAEWVNDVSLTRDPLRSAIHAAQNQLVHAGIQSGVGDGALDAARSLLARQTYTSNRRAGLNQLVADWEADSAAVHAVVQYAARTFDEALAHAPVRESDAALAVVAVDEAKSIAYEYAPDWSQRLIDFLDGDRTEEREGFDRFWRDARTHSLHDPVRWRQSFVGNYWLNGVPPPELARRLPPRAEAVPDDAPQPHGQTRSRANG